MADSASQQAQLANDPKILELVVAAFPGQAIESSVHRDQLTVIVPSAIVHDVLVFLKNHPTHGFSQLADITAVDYPQRELRFDVVYMLVDIDSSRRVRVKTRIPDRTGIPTVSGLWRSADWGERECFDMFGIQFDGHPDLKRILNTDDFYGYPLRKTYPVRGLGDPAGIEQYKELGEPA